MALNPRLSGFVILSRALHRGATCLMKMGCLCVRIVASKAWIPRARGPTGLEVDETDPAGRGADSGHKEVGIDLKLFCQFTPGPGLCSHGNNLGEAFLAFGGEQMCDQEFTIAQTRFGLLFDERVDVRFG